MGTIGVMLICALAGCKPSANNSPESRPLPQTADPDPAGPSKSEVPTSESSSTVVTPGKKDEPSHQATKEPMEVHVDEDEMIRIAAGPLADDVRRVLEKKITDEALIKNHTLVRMAIKVVRDQQNLTPFEGIIDQHQLLQARAIIDSHSEEWQDLLDRRAAILEKCRDQERVQQFLYYNKVAAVGLFTKIHSHIFVQVLTASQKEQMRLKSSNRLKATTPESKSSEKVIPPSTPLSSGSSTGR